MANNYVYVMFKPIDFSFQLVLCSFPVVFMGFFFVSVIGRDVYDDAGFSFLCILSLHFKDLGNYSFHKLCDSGVNEL